MNDEEGEGGGLIRDFVKGTYDRLFDCADCFRGDDAAGLKTQMDPNQWKHLRTPLTHLHSASKTLSHGKAGAFEKAMDGLEDFLKSHPVHLLTAAFRDFENPMHFTFDFLSCSLKKFLDRCNPTFMASVGKTAYMAIIEKEMISLSGYHLLTLLNSDQGGDIPSMEDFASHFEDDMVKVIFF